MFLNNKYTKWYYSIVNNASKREPESYCEKHHIIPRSLGGNNTKANLVVLTLREHYLCHLLLTYMLTGDSLIKMTFALYRMRGGVRKMNSKTFQKNRMKKLFNSEEMKIYMRKIALIPRSIEAKKKISKIATKTNLKRFSNKTERDKISKVMNARWDKFNSQKKIEELSKCESHVLTFYKHKRKKEQLRKLSDAGKGSNNPASKICTLLSPLKEIFKTDELLLFCKNHNLSYYAINTSFIRGYPFNPEKIYKNTKDDVKNSIGWHLISKEKKIRR